MDLNKLKLTFLLLIAVVPISLATWVFSLREVQGVNKTTNKGELLSPIIDITAFDFRDGEGRSAYVTFEDTISKVLPKDYSPQPWRLIYLGAPACDAVCTERLYFLRQLHIRLNAESKRVERVYAQVSDTLDPLPEATKAHFSEQQPDLKIVYALTPTVQALLTPTLTNGSNPITSHYIYVVDPLGNVMMFFTPENTPEQMLSDLDKLLDQSSVG